MPRCMMLLVWGVERVSYLHSQIEWFDDLYTAAIRDAKMEVPASCLILPAEGLGPEGQLK